MSDEYITVAVPSEHLEQMRVLVQLVQQSTAQRLAEDDQIALASAEAHALDAGSTIDVLLYLPVASALWLTNKFADEYLWPELKKRIDAPSRAAVTWLIKTASNATRKTRDTAVEQDG